MAARRHALTWYEALAIYRRNRPLPTVRNHEAELLLEYDQTCKWISERLRLLAAQAGRRCPI